MDRRGFVLGLAGLVGAGFAGAGLVASPAAATVLGPLETAVPPGGGEVDMPEAPEGLPLQDAQYWGPPGPPRGGWGRPPGPPPGYWRRRRRRQVCGWRRDRWGRPVRRCWYAWN